MTCLDFMHAGEQASCAVWGGVNGAGWDAAEIG